MVGQTISHYRIAEKLGEGGMGVVYKAEDLKLGRAVALKFLPSHLLESAEHKARFLHEARAAALLDHPNICTVYEIDEVNGQTFLAMACLGGQTLKQKIAARPLPLEETLDIAVQIGRGLQAAHEKGIVHRDIKPANIMISPQGQVKIMDFGLAQLADRTKLTATGTKLGTPAYMSPEQTEGKPTDRRSDIWALGVVLYEMVSGRVPFAGEAEASVAYAILHTEPEPLTALRSGIPVELDRVVKKALVKNSSDRYQHVEEMLVDLRSAKSPQPRAVKPGRRRFPITAVTALVVLILGLISFYSLRRPAAQAPWEALAIKPLTSFVGLENFPTWSPDGTLIAYSRVATGNMDIYVMPVGSSNAVRLTTGFSDEISPRWSPDGRYLAYVADPGTGANVYLIPPLGGLGSERKVAETGISYLEQFGDVTFALGAMPWCPDGRELLFSRSQSSEQLAAWKVVVTTGSQRPMTFPPPGATDLSASWSHDGERFVFVRQHSGRGSLWLTPARGGETRLLLGDPYRYEQPTWSADGRRIVFISDRAGPMNLWEIEIASGRLRQVTTGPSRDMFPVSARDGRLAYSSHSHQVDLHLIEVESRADERLTAHSHENLFPSFSPDGRRFVYQSDRTGDEEIWLFDLDSRAERQLTDHDAADLAPDWSPDGREIAFLTNREGSFQLWVMDPDGGSMRRLVDQKVPVPAGSGWNTGRVAPQWSPDGKSIGYVALSDRGNALWVADRNGEHARPRAYGLLYFDWYRDSQRVIYARRNESGLIEMRAADLENDTEAVLLTEPAMELAVSPDGRAVVYSRGVSHFNMNLQLLPLLTSENGLPRVAGVPIQLTEGRGQWHVHKGAWSPDGRSLVYTRDADRADIFVIENYR